MQRAVSRARTAGRQPLASTSATPCPACSSTSRSLSFSISAPTFSQAGTVKLDQPTPSSSSSQLQRVSSWSRALFGQGADDAKSRNSTKPPKRIEALPLELQRTVDDLLVQLRFKKPSPARVWSLFSQIDQQGATHALPAKALHDILQSLHQPRPKHLSVHSSTSLARAYALRADLVLLRLRRSGSAVSQSELSAMLHQYVALGYAPGAIQVWAEYQKHGWTSEALAFRVLTTMRKWCNLHRSEGGREVARVAAASLVDTAVAILDGLDTRAPSEKTLEDFFEILIHAGAVDVFSVAVKAVYGMDMAYPGAEVDASEAVKAKWRPVTEVQVLWALKMLAEADRLSSMIATLEVYDTPSSNPVPPSYDFFSSGSTPSSSGTSPLVAPPSLINSAALATIIAKASEMGEGPIARHYLDLLWSRWISYSHHALIRMEELVGIHWVPESYRATQEHASDSETSVWVDEAAKNVGENAGVNSAVAADIEAYDPSSQAIDVSGSSGSNDAESILDPKSSETQIESQTEILSPEEQLRVVLLSHPITAATLGPIPSQPYHVSSRLLARLVKAAKSDRDTTTARHVLRRVMHTAQAHKSHVERLSAVLSTLEPSDKNAPLPPSIARIHVELAHARANLAQSEMVLEHAKLDSTIVWSYRTTRRKLHHRNRQVRLLDAATQRSDRTAQLKTKAALSRTQKTVLLRRMVYLRQKLRRLQRLGRANPTGFLYMGYIQEVYEIGRKLGVARAQDTTDRAATVTTVFRDGKAVEVVGRDSVAEVLRQ